MQKLKPIGLVEKHINKKRYHLIASLLYEYVGKRMMMMIMWGNGVVGQALSMLLGKQCLLDRWYRTEISIVNAALDVLMMVQRQDRTGTARFRGQDSGPNL